MNVWVRKFDLDVKKKKQVKDGVYIYHLPDIFDLWIQMLP